MGMDVIGRNNQDAYFRANVWSWRTIWACTVDLQPWADEEVVYSGTNDGDGLDAEDALLLHKQLKEACEKGLHEEWIELWNAELERLDDEVCELCHGTGIRSDGIGMNMGMPTQEWTDDDGSVRVGWCNGCAGKGLKRPFEAWYGHTADHFEEWVDFLGECGGFEIW